MEIKVINPAGEEGTIQVKDLHKVLKPNSGYTLVDPTVSIPVVNPEGEEGIIPAKDYMKAYNAKYKFLEGKDILAGDAGWIPLIAKSLVNGALSIIDLPQTGYNLGKAAYNYASDKINGETDRTAEEKPHKNLMKGFTGEENLPYTSDVVKRGIKQITGFDINPKPKTSGQRIANNAAEFAGSMLAPGVSAKKGIGVLNRFVKSPAIGGAIGGVSGIAQEHGMNPLVADIAASATPIGGRLLAKGADRLAAKLAGLGKKSIDLPAGLAAKNLGVDLPTSALTDNTITNFIEHANDKNLFVGYFNKKSQHKVHRKIDEIIDDVINRTGMPNNLESRKIVKDAYIVAEGLLPKNAKIYPKTTHEVTNNVQNDLLKSLINSGNEKTVITAAEKIRKQIAPYNVKGIETPVENLVATKRSLNDIIDWKAPTDVKSRVKNIQGAIKNDLKSYGEINPDWYKELANADRMHAGIAKRTELQDLISNATNHATGNKSNYRIAQKFNEPTIKESIKGLVDKTDRSKIDDLGEVTRALYKREQANPNKSGTSYVTKALNMLHKPITYAPGTLLGGLHNIIINNPNFKNRAIDRAAGSKPPKSDALKLYDLNSYIGPLSQVSLREQKNRDKQ